MGIFDLLIVQPIFNLLVLIYSFIPGSDFGIALIIFTITVRVAMWPLVKKQLHQTKAQRAIQPELKKIKQKAKGNKQLEAQMMLELYREKGIKPMSSIGLLLLQLPIYIALFSVIQIITQHRDQIAKYTYDFLEGLSPIREVVNGASNTVNETLLGIVNLSKTAIEGGQVYWPVMVIVILTAVLQYFQSKQITPQPTENKRLRDIMAAAAQGKDVDQSEVSAIMSQRMIMFFPILTFLVMIYLPGAISLYMVVSSVVAILQQRHVLNQDVEEMEALADKPVEKKKNGTTVRVYNESSAQKRAANAKEAEVVSTAPKQRSKKRSKRR